MNPQMHNNVWLCATRFVTPLDIIIRLNEINSVTIGINYNEHKNVIYMLDVKLCYHQWRVQVAGFKLYFVSDENILPCILPIVLLSTFSFSIFSLWRTISLNGFLRKKLHREMKNFFFIFCEVGKTLILMFWNLKI